MNGKLLSDQKIKVNKGSELFYLISLKRVVASDVINTH
jgi:hypothetical protein